MSDQVTGMAVNISLHDIVNTMPKGMTALEHAKAMLNAQYGDRLQGVQYSPRLKAFIADVAPSFTTHIRPVKYTACVEEPQLSSETTIEDAAYSYLLRYGRDEALLELRKLQNPDGSFALHRRPPGVAIAIEWFAPLPDRVVIRRLRVNEVAGVEV